jgi:Histidine kinase
MTPMQTAAVEPPSPQRSAVARFAMRGVRSAILGAVIALMLTGGFGTPLWPNLVHSISIATMCWFATDLLRAPLAAWQHRHDPPGAVQARRGWPGWPLMLVAIAVGTLFGFSVGGEIANLILGGRVTGGYFRGNWRQSVALLLGSLVPGTVITYWFYSRETISAKEAAVQTAQRQAAEHQLKLLESQLEPHMLFNTLANLRVLIGTDPKRAQTMLDQLIAFLRATLAGSRASWHPLGAEYARLADYLALMRTRMGERLTTHLVLPEALAAWPVPPLLLQPLVENCIKHGLEPTVAGGRIDVIAAREGDTLVLAVRDTGVGLAHATDGETKFGLLQVRERLATLYGNAASLTLAQAEDTEGGTLATLRLPMIPSATTLP